MPDAIRKAGTAGEGHGARLVRPGGAHIRWTGTAGAGYGGPPRVYVHGLGATSAVHHVHIAAVPALADRRPLFVDLPGHGISDRPVDFGYPLEDHADALASALDAAGVRGAELIGHGMGGSVAIVHPTALHRSACVLVRGTRPTMRKMLLGLPGFAAAVAGQC